MATKPMSHVQHCCVNDLMLTDRQSWNIPLIKEMFNERDVEEIKGIPLFNTNDEDMMMWRLNSTGCYSVRSEYRLLMEELGDR